MCNRSEKKMTLKSMESEIALRRLFILSLDRLLNNRNKMASVVCKMFEIIVSLRVSLSIREALNKCNLFHHSDSWRHNSCSHT